MEIGLGYWFYGLPQALDTDCHCLCRRWYLRISLIRPPKGGAASNKFPGCLLNMIRHQNTFHCLFYSGGVLKSHLNDAYYLFPLGEDEFGQRF